MKTWFVLTIGVASAPMAGRAQVPGPSFRDVIDLKSVGSPAISPDGKAVAYTVRTPEWADNRFDSEIWLWREGQEPIQLTRTPKGSSGSPQWSPDGKWIGFLADRGDRQQLYLIGAAGGEAMKLTAIKEGVNDFRWSPAGGRVALSVSEPEDGSKTKSKALYGDFYSEDRDFRLVHLWVLEVDPSRWTGDTASAPKPARLTGGTSYTVGSFAFSPDGNRIAFDHRRDPMIHSMATADISIVDLGSKSVTPLVERVGSDTGPVWSPDGEWIAFTTSAGDTVSNFYRNNQLAKVAARGGEPTRLAVDFDEMIGQVLWTPQAIWFNASEKTRSGFVKVDPATGVAERDRESPFLSIGGGSSVTPDGRWWVIMAQKDAMSLMELYRGEVTGASGPERLTDMTGQITSWNLGTSEVVSWSSRDGTSIEGVLHKPRDFQPGKKYPLLVVIHGGPTGTDRPQPVPFYVYPIPQWVAKGALVLRPNYRGSAGYGEKFRSLNVRNLGVGDLWDVMSGVDHLVKQGVVDTARMGAMGWSQGGYISAFLTTNTNRFKAISVGAGISNWVSYYVTTDIYPFTRQYLKATPWDDMAVYLKTSPMTTIKQAKTPTLIQHGQFDLRVPIQNAYELHQGLLDQRVPTELIIYRGFGHGINKPKEQLAAVWHNYRWFGKYVFNEEVVIPLEDDPKTAAKAGGN
jgi:dipeptidyl aminopeptidase/acylaminoacyl peptidase